MIPIFPNGATIFSVMGASKFLGRTVTVPSGRVLRAWGMGADVVARECLGSAALAEEVLTKHTFAPLRLALMEDSAAAEFKNSFVEGSVRGLNEVGLASVARRCPGCVASDTSKVGTAFPRLLHQLRPVHHCPEHQCALEECCAKCGYPFSYFDFPLMSKPGFLAGEIRVCEHCGGEAGVPLAVSQAEIYALFVDLLASAWSGRHWALKPLTRQYLIDTSRQVFAMKGGIRGTGLGSLSYPFVRAWDAIDLQDAASMCGTKASALSDRLSRGNDASNDPLASFAATAFALLYLRDPGHDYLHGRLNPPGHGLDNCRSPGPRLGAPGVGEGLPPSPILPNGHWSFRPIP